MKIVAAVSEKKSRPVTSPGHDERQARAVLSAAIEARNAAEKNLAEAAAAAERAEQMIFDAEANLEAAAAAAAKAREGAVALAVAAASSGSPMLPGSTREASEARARQVEAGEWLEACHVALSECQRALEEPERELRKAKENVAKLADAVMRTATERAIEACDRARVEFVNRHAALLVHRELHYEPHEVGHGEMFRTIERTLSATNYGEYTSEGAALWRRARDELKDNSEALLPSP